jgi:hypothetical protein
MAVATVTPAKWKVTIIDENPGVPDYESMPRPDLVGITAFTSQSPRAYEIAAVFNGLEVPVAWETFMCRCVQRRRWREWMLW